MNIEETILRILVDDLFVDATESQISLDDSLRNDLGLDSLGFAELRAQCEYAFDVKISNEDFVPENFSSVRVLGQLVARLRSVLPDPAVSL